METGHNSRLLRSLESRVIRPCERREKAFPSDNIISGGGHKQACGLKIIVNSSETALTLEKLFSRFVGFCLSLKFRVVYGLPGTYNEKENFVFPLVSSGAISDLSSHVIETVKKNGTKVSTTYIVVSSL